MASTSHALLPLRSWRFIPRNCHVQTLQKRSVSAGTLRYRQPPPPLPHPSALPPGMTYKEYKDLPKAPIKIKVHSPPPSAAKTTRDPIANLNATQVSALDPTGLRTRFLAKTNPDAAHVGDVVLVRFRSGDPFAGVVLSIRRRGVDTAILLRNALTRVGVEMWVKVYSPLVAGMELVEQKPKQARRARLYYMRKPKHDRGSLESLVERYLRMKKATGRGLVGGKKKGQGAGPARGPAGKVEGGKVEGNSGVSKVDGVGKKGGKGTIARKI